MAFFFRPYPTVRYRVPKTNKTIAATNITKRFGVTNFLNNAKATFDEYYVQDGERPDIVATQYYGDQTLDWLVLLVNEIHDPYFQWVLSYELFNNFLRQKYGSVEYTQSTVHHYEQIIQQYRNFSDNGVQRIIPEKTLTVDYTTYASLTAPERKIVTIFEYENEINENNRHIYLLDLNYTLLIKEQHPYIFDEGTYFR
jgi:hypothetical protein